MKQKFAYIITLILMACAIGAQIKANGYFNAAKLRIAELTARLPMSTDRSELIRNDEIRKEHSQQGKTWARPALAFNFLGIASFFVAIARRERAWYSIPIILIIFYGVLATTS